jgi:hypothetical protein
MAKTTQTYTVPLTGRMLNWETLSGDPDDPVDVIGPNEFASKASFDWTQIVDKEDHGVTTRLRSLDVDAGTAEVTVEAHPMFHSHLTANLVGKTPEAIAAELGKGHLKRPPGAPMPPAFLTRFNR